MANTPSALASLRGTVQCEALEETAVVRFACLPTRGRLLPPILLQLFAAGSDLGFARSGPTAALGLRSSLSTVWTTWCSGSHGPAASPLGCMFTYAVLRRLTQLLQTPNHYCRR